MGFPMTWQVIYSCEHTHPNQFFLFRFRKRTDYTGVSGSQVILFQYLVRIPVTFICRWRSWICTSYLINDRPNILWYRELL